MANSSDVAAGQTAQATQYNNLRADALNISTGHRHGGGTDEGNPLFGILNINNPATGLNYANDTNYQAPRDLFVIIQNNTGISEGYSGTSNPASTLLTKTSGGAMFPVRKGDWWRVKSISGSQSIYVMSIGGV